MLGCLVGPVPPDTHMHSSHEKTRVGIPGGSSASSSQLISPHSLDKDRNIKWSLEESQYKVHTYRRVPFQALCMGHTLGSKLCGSRATWSVSPFTGTIKSNQITCSGCPFSCSTFWKLFYSKVSPNGGKRSLLIRSNAKIQLLEQSPTKIDPQSGDYIHCFLFCFCLVSWSSIWSMTCSY